MKKPPTHSMRGFWGMRATSVDIEFPLSSGNVSLDICLVCDLTSSRKVIYCYPLTLWEFHQFIQPFKGKFMVKIQALLKI